MPWVSPSITVSEDDWENLARIGVRGLRFPIYGLPTPQWSYYKDMLAEAKKRDWPIHLYVESKRLPEILPVLLDGGNKVVIPHYGMFDRTLGPARDPGFKVLLESAPGRNVWVVMCGAYRVGPERARAATSMLLDAFGAGSPDVGQRLAAHRHGPQPRHDLSADPALVRGMGARQGDTADDPGRHAGQALRVLEELTMHRVRTVALASVLAIGTPAVVVAQQTAMEPKARCDQLLAYWDQRSASKGEGASGSDMARKSAASIATIAATPTASSGWRTCCGRTAIRCRRRSRSAGRSAATSRSARSG